jgi:hypothetical protein
MTWLLRLWSLPLGLPRVVVLLLIPWWRGTWVPYWPRKVRWHNGCLHFIAGRIIPKGIDRTGDGDIDDPEDFRTGAQTHWFMTWFADEIQWLRASLIEHEEWHVHDEDRWGPIYPTSYVGHFLINVVRFKGNIARAYQEIVWERRARAHAGQRVS